MLVRDWPELMSEVADLEAPADVTPYVMARINAAHPRTASRWAADRRGASLLGTPIRWLVASVGVVVVVLVLAIAAHSRDSGRSRTLDAPQQSSALIVPGVRIGPAAIGASRRRIERIVGKPDKVVRARSGGGIVATYSDAGLAVTYQRVAYFGDIPVRGRQAVQIRTTSPRYATAAGVRVGSTLSSAQRAYPGIKCSATDLGGGNDCVFGGTTFEVWEGIQVERPYKIQAVSVAGTGSVGGARPAQTTLSGVVLIEGGPLQLNGQTPGIRRLPSARLVVTGRTTSGARLARHLTADTDGRFALEVPAGTYTVTALIVQNSPMAQQPSQKVKVRDGRAVHVRITFAAS